MDKPIGRVVRKRCAIYTRKSTEEGLDQAFNSLDAQQEACAAYVASQKHEGWLLSERPYDDGGLSGGSMQRPALLALLEDIKEKRVDIVVVYKVDRLTRSLADFAKLTELFDAHGASFVSVTQQFNTSTSMGRLTLNVLLSFAQFEREVAGERIRDKIALSKQRGMWMGGLPPLGYDPKDKQLVVNACEAKTVRHIYQSYLDCGSLVELKDKLDNEGVVSKKRHFENGKTFGGVPITRGALYQILRNRIYRGEIAHRGQIYQGNHKAIVDPDLWDQVQAKLIERGRRARTNTDRSKDNEVTKLMPALLTGLVFDAQGNRLTPTHTKNRGKRYCYYVSASLVRGKKATDGIRIPAADLEQLVLNKLAKRLRDPSWLTIHFGAKLEAHQIERLIKGGQTLSERFLQHDQNLVRALIDRVIIEKPSIIIWLKADTIIEQLTAIEHSLVCIEPVEETIVIKIDAHRLRCGKQVKLIIGDARADRHQIDDILLKLIIDARRWFEELKSGKRHSIAHIARVEKREQSDISRSLSLAFLAPDIVEMIVTGTQPLTLTTERLRAARPLPPSWSKQRSILLDQS